MQTRTPGEHHAPHHLSVFSLALAACAPTAEELSLLGQGALDRAIVGGQLATANQTYATVALFDPSAGEPFCSGTLNAPQVVVTAAHCLKNQGGSPTQPSQVEIVADVLDANQAPANHHHVVAAVVAREDYLAYGFSNAPEGLGNDMNIGVLLLEAPVAGVTPAPVLPLDEVDGALSNGTSLVLTGFGVTSENAQSMGTLYIAEAPYVRRSETEFLAGANSSGVDSCYGDSGGPVYLETPAGMVLIGATSRGTATSSQRGDGGIYGLVSAFEAWIEDHSCGLYVGSGQGADLAPPDPSAQGSCEGNCGGFDDNSGCYCDNDCQDYGDCCADLTEVCGLPGGDGSSEPVDMDALCAGISVPVGDDDGDGDGDVGDGDGDVGDGDGDVGDGDGDGDGGDGDGTQFELEDDVCASQSGSCYTNSGCAAVDGDQRPLWLAALGLLFLRRRRRG